ncbi:hypothetical protein Tco_1145814 [Tanacetum coccineum]
MQQPMQHLKDISDPTTAIDMTLALMAKAFTLNNTTLTNNNQRSSSNPSNMQIAQLGMNMDQDRHMLMVEDNVGNQFRPNVVQNVKNQVVQNAVQNPGIQTVNNINGLSVVSEIANQYRNGDVVTEPVEGNGNGINGNPIRCYNYRGEGHYGSNCTVKPRKRDAAYLHTQLRIAQKDEAGIQLNFEEFDFMAAVGAYDEIEKMDQLSMEQSGGTVEQHPINVEETRVLYDSLYNNLAIEVEKVKSVNRKLRETNADLTSELARYKNQEKCFEINQEKYDKLERCYQKSVYQEQCLTKKINALHLSSVKQITILNEEIANLNNQLSKEKSTISFLQEERKKLKNDFKIQVDKSLTKHKALELEIERLLRAVVSKDIMSIVQRISVVDTSNLQTELDPYNDMQQKIKRLQAQLGDLKGKSKDTPCVSDTLDSLSHKLENESAELEFQVSEQKDSTKGTSMNTQFRKQLILGKPPSSSGSKLYSVTPFPKSKGLPKIDESHALSKPVTINPFKTSREEKSMPNKPIKASVRTKLITVSQPHVSKKDVNSDSNGLSSTGVDNTVKTRRPQPRSNTKNDRVPFASNSSCNKNKEVEVEEHPRNLLLSKNKKHMSTECNNIKLAIRNDKSEDVCAICIQCLITFNHDVCVLNYVNGMNSRVKKTNANVSNTANKRKHNITQVQVNDQYMDV